MTKPVVASVSEPVSDTRPPVPPTPPMFIISRWHWFDRGTPPYWMHLVGGAQEKDRAKAEKWAAEYVAAGDRDVRVVEVPGETDDAPPATANGWRPASEPPDTQMRNVLILCAGKDPSCAYINDGMWWESLSRLRLYNVTHWHELPEPPK